ncbi:MAG: chemotaxis protein CheW [Betaproteobacteria bacterium]|nr:chemotaxis protein CheW [Betaproteobacteria bacterium]
MTQSDNSIAVTVATLRREFDSSFAQPPATDIALRENFLAVRIGGDAYAIRVAEIGGLYADRHVVPLPTPMPELLGLAGFRGQIAPVYDLAALLGYAPRTSPRWLVLVRRRETVALAFDAFEGQLMVSPERIVTPTNTTEEGETRPHVRGAVQTGNALRPIVNLPLVFDDIQKRVETAHSSKER